MAYTVVMELSEHTYGFDEPPEELFEQWTGPAIGLLDLDAFFASVEMLDHPEWRGKPVIVGGDPEHRGVVSTASYEARKYGVHSAMSSAQALRLCPDAIWTHGNFPRYREMSASVMACLERESPFVEQVSIDEAFFDITPGRFGEENPVEVVRRVSRSVAELGVTCSIGLGSSKSVAKIASEQNKPRGTTVVLPGCERAFLAPLPVRAMSGIGGAAEARLAQAGIRTLGQLAEAEPEILEAVFGAAGESMRARALGCPDSDVRARADAAPVKSVSNERTFPHDLTDRADVDAALALLGENVGRRLRKKGLAGATVTVKLKFSYGSGRTIQRKLAHPTDDENIFVAEGARLIDSIWADGMHVRLLGIGMSDFDRAGGVQADLFRDIDERGAEVSERRKLSVAVDKIREKYGDSSLAFGRAARFEDRSS